MISCRVHPSRHSFPTRRSSDLVASSGVETLDLPARDATDEDLERAHDRAYLDELARLSGYHAALDADTYLAPRSVEAARRGAGGTKQRHAGLHRRIREQRLDQR